MGDLSRSLTSVKANLDSIMGTVESVPKVRILLVHAQYFTLKYKSVKYLVNIDR